jgi:hypothetical protein
MDRLGMIVLFVMGVIAFNFGRDNRSIASATFGILLEIIAITYIVYKILKQEQCFDIHFHIVHKFLF